MQLIADEYLFLEGQVDLAEMRLAPQSIVLFKGPFDGKLKRLKH